ncbi:hypothetical protein PCANC_02653 [Puccinia coronata f. sp. avenae]|uniref:Uncharacterized protein n=1 Tax=Puccinia coronata f. sp. avenae TaxID=200324 RepID=A0A2N5T5F7_9BASI|nr:hypothetical protein PCANC_09302 [Puccinia coronata f. sp. avenae]PLW57455.1 hypothetical protein PCANC_02653 [Puccinia coronata f. sp. avenae]
MSTLTQPVLSNLLSVSEKKELQAQPSNPVTLSQSDLEDLGKLPIDSLDTIRSKLVQLIDAITVFRSQLETSPLTPNSLSYPTLISKFLILLNHTEALSQALNTPLPSQPVDRFELPSVRAEREEREKWEHGPGKQSVLGNLATVPRGLEGLEDGKEWIVGVLTRTKLAPEIEKDEQDLLSLLPPPPTSDSTPTVGSLLEHVKSLTQAHEKHIANCRTALHKARYGRVSEKMEVDISSENGNGDEGDAKYQWKMRVEVDDQSKGYAPAVPLEGPVTENLALKNLIGFMRDGRKPTLTSPEES